MTETKDPRQDEAAPQDLTAPQVSLRQAVRPVIVAYGVLLRQRQAAGELVEEAESLQSATEELLRKLGLVLLLTSACCCVSQERSP